MTILQLISSGGFYGAESMLLSLSESLSRLGCEVIVAVLRDSRDPHVEVAEAAQRAGLETKIIPCDGRFDRKAIASLRTLLKERAVDVLHAHGYKADIYGYLANWGSLANQRARLVSTCHNWPNPLKRMQWYAVMDRLFLKGFDHVTTPSPLVADILRNSGIRDNRLSFVSNGVDTERFGDAVSSSQTEALRAEWNCGDRPVIGFVGRMVAEKGGAVFLNAAKTVLASEPSALFVLAGDGPSREEWQALAHSLGIAGSVVFAGVRKDMPSVYRTFDVMVLPSFEEAMPMCLLEAMAAGKPTIATRVGAVPDLIADDVSGILMEPGDESALSAAILRLIGDPETRMRLGSAARTHIVQRYSADAMAQTYWGLYNQCLATRWIDSTPVQRAE